MAAEVCQCKSITSRKAASFLQECVSETDQYANHVVELAIDTDDYEDRQCDSDHHVQSELCLIQRLKYVEKLKLQVMQLQDALKEARKFCYVFHVSS